MSSLRFAHPPVFRRQPKDPQWHHGTGLVVVFALIAIFFVQTVSATETENFNLAIVPAPGAVTVDGNADDWDLTAGIFACGDVENQRDKFGVWFHAMYDAEKVYLLARWMDPTPMNNPGSSKGDYGFNGDCLQVRFSIAPNVMAPNFQQDGGKDERTSHLTCWRDREGLDVVDICYGRGFNEGSLKDAKSQGAEQAFKVFPDGKGYTQEIAIPWKLLSKPGVTPKTGSKIMITVEPNFTVGTGGRLTIKDIFKPGVGLDRVFTFGSNMCWGYGTLEEPSKTRVPRSIRLSDGREFPVRMENGFPVVDWTGVIKSREPEGFKTIHFSMPEDGYVSLNINSVDGTVARQLLACAFYTKGEHDVKWDGLTTMSVRTPGQPVAAGDYTWSGIYHTGIGLRLRGWAGNSGNAPWGGGTWGADHGNPVACAADNERVYLGWNGGEGAQPLVACDPNGNVLWKNIRGGIATASIVAADETTVYAWNNIGQYATRAIYRLDSHSGRYTEWSDLKSTDLTMKALWGDAKDAPDTPDSFAARGGKVFISFGAKDAVMVVDAKSGKLLKTLTVPKPGALKALSGKEFVAFSDGKVVAVDTESGSIREIVKIDGSDTIWASALALDKTGRIYVGMHGENQVRVYSGDGKLELTIGRKGGRALIGPWTPDGMFNISGMDVDAQGKLWVAEDDGSPRRVSVWDTKTGAFKMEFFGATGYGALGGAINPIDPYLMVGSGCEWRIDPKTAKATCLGVITRDGMGACRFGFGRDGKEYLAVTPGFLYSPAPIQIFERLGDANYKLRTAMTQDTKNGTIKVWSDENDDGIEQPEEVKTYKKNLGGWFQGWYMPMTSDLTFYGSMFQVKVTGWTACGAPKYDFDQEKPLPGPKDGGGRGGMGAQHNCGSADNSLVLWNGFYGEDHSTVDCYDMESGKLRWTYPSNFTGVHGSHRACAPEVGMMRGAYDIVGTAKFPAPVGNIWVIPTNKGEWHVLTEQGFYLTRIFQGDPMRTVYPERATPGAILDDCPPGAGEEAFGGSICQDKDGKLSVQAGHTSFWNVEVTGMETIKALPTSGKIEVSVDDTKVAHDFRERYVQDAAGVKQIKIKKATPTFSGDLDKDFAGVQIAEYQKMPAARVRTALAWDDQNLYAAWEVKDDTPWQNSADAPENLYIRGDTVDLQLGTDPNAKPDRKDAVLGDLRLSIGPFQGKASAVLYRKVAAEKHPMSFSSGVMKNYEMESVTFPKEIKADVHIDKVKKQYTLEATIPLSVLGLSAKAGLKIRGDFGATHGNRENTRTALRSYWSNQQTGLVSDAVFELQPAPANWGEMLFTE